MKVLIPLACLLSVALVTLRDTPAKQLNNSTHPTQATAEQATQRTRPDAQPVKQDEQPEVKTEPELKPEIAVKVETPAPQPLTDHEQLMQAAGIQQSDWFAVEYIISHESSWRPTILNNEGCVGLGQRCPASILYAACPDLEPICQLRHFSNYAVSRYGGWQQAYTWWLEHKWW